MTRWSQTVLFVMFAAMLIGPSGARADVRDFLGFWQGIDTLDGSEISVSITDHNRDKILEVRITETFFKTCVDADKSGFPGLIEGTGTVAGKTLTFTFSFKCYDSTTKSLTEILTDTATFQRKRKTLVDDFGNILHRLATR